MVIHNHSFSRKLLLANHMSSRNALMMNLFSVVQWGPEFTCSPRPAPHIAFDIVGCRTPPWASPARVVIRASSARVDRAAIDVEARTAEAGKHHFRSVFFSDSDFFPAQGVPRPSWTAFQTGPTEKKIGTQKKNKTALFFFLPRYFFLTPVFFGWRQSQKKK